MNINFRLFLFLTTAFFSFLTNATVGGPQAIQILGYDIADQKIYYTLEYQDETGRLPVLFYYSLQSKSSHKPVQVHSIYKSYNQNRSEKEYEKVLSNILSIQKRLKPLSSINHSSTQIIIKNIEEKLGYFWTYHDDHLVNKITSTYTVKNKTHTSNRVTSTSFQRPDLKITQLFNVNDRSKQYQLAIVEYLGVPEETGYTKQDAILLKRN